MLFPDPPLAAIWRDSAPEWRWGLNSIVHLPAYRWAGRQARQRLQISGHDFHLNSEGPAGLTGLEMTEERPIVIRIDRRIESGRRGAPQLQRARSSAGAGALVGCRLMT